MRGLFTIAVLGGLVLGQTGAAQAMSNEDKRALGAAMGAAAIGLAVGALSHHRGHHNQDKPYTATSDVTMFERGYRDAIHGGDSYNYDRSSAYSDGYNTGLRERDARLTHNRPSAPGSTRHGATAEVQMACAKEGDRYWDLPGGSSVPMRSTSTGSGMFEVTLAAGNIRGTCTVTEGGDVKSIMEN